MGLQDSHLHWYGLELGSGPAPPLWTTVPLGGAETRHRCPCQVHTWFSAAGRSGREGVAPLTVRAPEVLAPSAVAFSRSALPPSTGA